MPEPRLPRAHRGAPGRHDSRGEDRPNDLGLGRGGRHWPRRAGRPSARRPLRSGWRHLQSVGRRADAEAAADRGRGDPPRHSAALRHGRHPRPPHHIPGAARRGRGVRPGLVEADGASRGGRGRCGRPRHDLSRRCSTSRAIRAGAASSRALARTRGSLRAIADAKIRGFQGRDLAATDSLAATAKHLAAYGAVIAGRDYAPVDISERTLHEIYLPPFEAAVAAGRRRDHAGLQRLRRRADDAPIEPCCGIWLRGALGLRGRHRQRLRRRSPSSSRMASPRTWRKRRRWRFGPASTST